MSRDNINKAKCAPAQLNFLNARLMERQGMLGKSGDLKSPFIEESARKAGHTVTRVRLESTEEDRRGIPCAAQEAPAYTHGPSREGSSGCRNKGRNASIAAGGTREYCTCDACF